MRIIILGAAGRTGRAVRASLLPLSGIEAVILADREAEALNRMASLPAPFHVSTRFLDAADARSLHERVAEADVVIGCLGPAYRCEENVVDAVLETGRDYLSLCDDTRAYMAALSRQEEARRKGARIYLACGVTPGISGLLARRACALLDRVRSVRFYWAPWELFSMGDAAVAQMARSFTGKTAVLQARREERVRAGGWAEVVEFPPPAGRRLLHYLDHPEPLAVPRFAPEVEDSCFKAGLGNGRDELMLHTLAWLKEEGYRDLCWYALRVAAARGRRGNGPCPFSLRITVEGVRRGGPWRVSLGLNGDYYLMSGVAVAEVVRRMSEGGMPGPGVHTLDECLDDRVFLERLRRAGARFFLAEEKTSRRQQDGPREG